MVTNDCNLESSKYYSIVWSELGPSIVATAQNFRNDERSADITISAGGKIFFAHRLVLSAASPLLMQLLRHTRCNHPILMLAGISASDFEIILDFAYKGEINISSEKLPSLLQAAQILDVRALTTTISVLNTLQSNSNNSVISQNRTDGEKETIINTSTHDGDAINAFIQSRNGRLPKDDPIKLSKTYTVIDEHQIHQSVENTDDFTSDINPNDEITISGICVRADEKNQGGKTFDEKKIISDLPVKCKFCGVIIRQSRNLRRHVDQMHSKSKCKRKHLSESTQHTNVLTCENDKNSSVFDMSEDSFSLLTKEILKYSAHSEVYSKSSSSKSHSPVNTCLNNITSIDENPSNFMSLSNSITTHSNTTDIISAKTEPAMPSSESVITLTGGRDTKSIVSSSDQQYQTSNSSNANQENNIYLKDLENQLFSACFCSTEAG